MVDVRSVFAGFFALVLAAAVGARRRIPARARHGGEGRRVAGGRERGPRTGDRDRGRRAPSRSWPSRPRSRSSTGSSSRPARYTFDPRTDKLVQLFPEAFWSETAIFVGAVVLHGRDRARWWLARRARHGVALMGIPIARILGIEIRVPLSWTIVLAVVAVIAVGQLTAVDPDLPTHIAWILGGVVALGFFLSSMSHDLAHAVVARRRGVDVSSIVVSFFGGATPLDPDVAGPAPRHRDRGVGADRQPRDRRGPARPHRRRDRARRRVQRRGGRAGGARLPQPRARRRQPRARVPARRRADRSRPRLAPLRLGAGRLARGVADRPVQRLRRHRRRHRDPVPRGRPDRAR